MDRIEFHFSDSYSKNCEKPFRNNTAKNKIPNMTCIIAVTTSSYYDVAIQSTNPGTAIE